MVEEFTEAIWSNVDPQSGDRVVLSSETVGEGEEMIRPRHLTIVPGAPSRAPAPATLAWSTTRTPRPDVSHRS